MPIDKGNVDADTVLKMLLKLLKRQKNVRLLFE